MAMSWTSLSAAKGVSGSIANWVAYTLLDLPPIIDEAQALLYSLMRTREMMTELVFSIPANGSYLALPARFLDPIGRIRATSINQWIAHKDQNFIEQNRTYTENTGSLGTNPFTTANGSNTVTVALTGHNLTQDSLFNTAGATAFNGVTINGTFPVTSIVDANDFNIDISNLGTTPTGSGAGGGSAVTYIADQLTTGSARWFGIWNENIYFDCSFSQQSLCRLQYYQSLPLLSNTNQTNFLTNRYPQLMRTACVTAAADFMKDDNEYQKGVTRLQNLVAQINIENDMYLRGMELDTDTP